MGIFFCCAALKKKYCSRWCWCDALSEQGQTQLHWSKPSNSEVRFSFENSLKSSHVYSKALLNGQSPSCFYGAVLFPEPHAEFQKCRLQRNRFLLLLVS